MATTILGYRITQRDQCIPQYSWPWVAQKDFDSKETIRADILFAMHRVYNAFLSTYLGRASDIGLRGTSWEQFGTNIASALVGLATNQKFNFSLMIMNGMLGHISNGTPFLMYPKCARTPDQCAAQASVSQRTVEVQGTANSQGTAEVQDASQTSGGDEGLLDLYALNREVRRLKKQTLSQAKLIRKLKAKLKNLSKVVAPVVKHHAFWVESQHLAKQKRRRKKHKKKMSSVKLGRNKEEGTLSEEHYVQDDTADPFFEDIVDKDAAVTPDIERKSDETEALERKSDETEEINYKSDHQAQALETTNDEGVARKIQAEWDAEEEKKRLEELKKAKPKTTSLAQERNQMMNFLKGQGYKNLQKDSTLYEHIPPTGLGLILLGDLTTIWETPETSDDDFWKNQEDWEIIRWRLNESSGVHTLELEDGTMIHMLAERRYPSI
ncbi:hypothetical protein Tco_0622633 [Tanacetum coccineum]